MNRGHYAVIVARGNWMFGKTNSRPRTQINIQQQNFLKRRALYTDSTHPRGALSRHVVDFPPMRAEENLLLNYINWFSIREAKTLTQWHNCR